MNEARNMHPEEEKTGKPLVAMTALLLLSLSLGSLHSFSVLLPALEESMNTSRGMASMSYSLALVVLAATVLLGPRFYDALPSSVLALITGITASLGCLLAALASDLLAVWLGYGLLFGAANGLGYGFALQFSAQLFPNKGGSAMGMITAVYATGALLSPPLFAHALSLGGWQSAQLVSAALLLCTGLLACLLLKESALSFAYAKEQGTTEACRTPAGLRKIAFLWIAFGCAVTSGLMVMGHAVGLSASLGLAEEWFMAVPMLVAGSNLAGSFLCGILQDRLKGRCVPATLALLNSVALIIMIIVPDPLLTLAVLSFAGFVYGGTVTSYPAFLSREHNSRDSAAIFGKVFTAWAVAGFAGPALAGFLFDMQGNYTDALLFAALLGFVSALALNLPKESA
ncbi:MFS transporter [Kiloniella sp. b19]|uniref:MFS transporter n=1 Tax=Kiloniella sp. GXU_MW_B19 TaxID=3141326 RepID=UPI0031E413E9